MRYDVNILVSERFDDVKLKTDAAVRLHCYLIGALTGTKRGGGFACQSVVCFLMRTVRGDAIGYAVCPKGGIK